MQHCGAERQSPELRWCAMQQHSYILTDCQPHVHALQASYPLESPVSPALYPFLSVSLTAGGLVAAASLYVYAAQPCLHPCWCMQLTDGCAAQQGAHKAAEKRRAGSGRGAGFHLCCATGVCMCTRHPLTQQRPTLAVCRAWASSLFCSGQACMSSCCGAALQPWRAPVQGREESRQPVTSPRSAGRQDAQITAQTNRLLALTAAG